jgi:transketolase
VLVEETAALDTILIGTGSEVQHCVAAAKELGKGTRVVSLPCWTRFQRQDAGYREAVLPKAVRRRVSIEAGVTLGWERWVGTEGRALGIDRFGMSAPGPIVMEKLGMNAKSVIDAVKSLSS